MKEGLLLRLLMCCPKHTNYCNVVGKCYLFLVGYVLQFQLCSVLME